jgi:hypothetical protein
MNSYSSSAIKAALVVTCGGYVTGEMVVADESVEVLDINTILPTPEVASISSLNLRNSDSVDTVIPSDQTTISSAEDKLQWYEITLIQSLL